MTPTILLLMTASQPAYAGKRGYPSNRVGALTLDMDMGQALPDTLIPGRPVPFAVKVTRDDGVSISTSDGSLHPVKNRVTLTVQGLEIDRVNGIITPIGDGPWALTVSYKRRPDLDKTWAWTADRTALLGPPSAALSDLRLTTQAEDLVDGWLLPGTSVSLSVAVEDVYGRIYTTDPYSAEAGAPLHLPWERVKVQAQGMTWHVSDATLHALGDRDLVPEAGYSVAVSVGDASDQASWAADFARRDGPDADDVQALRWKLLRDSGDAVEQLVEPGSVLRLQAEVDSSDGRTFATGDELLHLPTDQLRVTVRGGSWSADTGKITIAGAAEPIAMVGKELSVSVGLDGRNDLRTTLNLRPDLLAPLSRWLDLQEEKLTLVAPAGAAGAAGKAGEAGRDGSDGGLSPPTEVAADAGADGAAGTQGGNGGPGVRGPTVRVHAAEAWSLDGTERLVVFRVERDGEREYGLKRWHDGPVSITATGGSGGGGGKGGDGGKGGIGGNGCLAGAGGSGGDGGSGGAGGPGAQGGSILFVGSRSALESHFVLTAPGGAGGLAGEAGGAGDAGIPGESVTTYNATLDQNVPVAGCTVAEAGQAGAAGTAGTAGQPGQPGNISRELDEEAWDHLHDMPAELRRYLLAARR